MKQWDVTGEMRKRLLKAFSEAGIEIPYPHRVVVARENRHDSQIEDISASEVGTAV
jgi:small-conductance mechanosensitive channel